MKTILQVVNLYQLSTTLGLEPVSIIHFTRLGSSIKWPTPNKLATQRHVNWPVVYPESSNKIINPLYYQRPSPIIFEESSLQLWSRIVWAFGSQGSPTSASLQSHKVSFFYVFNLAGKYMHFSQPIGARNFFDLTNRRPG